MSILTRPLARRRDTSRNSPAGMGQGPDYRPALDGVRALAVISVMLYHAGVSWARGGFLGVDVFFVLSGYLITTLLVTEWDRWGTIDVVEFYRRRARRLLPALFLLTAAIAVWAGVAAKPDRLASIRADGIATLLLRRQLALHPGEASYFDQFGDPSPFRHTWSLAIEEQYYLFCPVAADRPARLVAAAALAAAGRHRRSGRAQHRADGGALRPCRRPLARVLRHRHPHPRAAHRLPARRRRQRLAPPWAGSTPAGQHSVRGVARRRRPRRRDRRLDRPHRPDRVPLPRRLRRRLRGDRTAHPRDRAGPAQPGGARARPAPRGLDRHGAPTASTSGTGRSSSPCRRSTPAGTATSSCSPASPQPSLRRRCPSISSSGRSGEVR